MFLEATTTVLESFTIFPQENARVGVSFFLKMMKLQKQDICYA